MKLLKICLLAVLILTVGGTVANTVLNKDKDGEAPVLTAKKDAIKVRCDYTDEDLLEGMTAEDQEDGDLTDRIIIGNFSKFKSRGKADLEYVVFDSDGNHASYTREVEFDDYEPPKITFSEPCVFSAGGSANGALKQNTEAMDLIDGDVTKRVKITDTDADFDVPGDYTFSVYAVNSFGDEVTMEFPVHILDPARSGIAILLEESVLYLDKGASFDPKKYISAVSGSGSGKALTSDLYKMTIDSDVDTSKNGIYEVHYSAVSTDGFDAGDTWLIVVVGEYGG